MTDESKETLQNDPLPWQTISQEYLYKCPWLTVRKEHVKLANGAEIDDYYLLEYTDWVNAALTTNDDEVLLIRIYRHGIGAVHYELPGGCVDPNEAPVEAAKRETLEETGYTASEWSSLGICCANPATHTNRTYLFHATCAIKAAEAELEPTEEIVSVLLPISEIPRLLDNGLVISASHALALANLYRKLSKIGYEAAN